MKARSGVGDDGVIDPGTGPKPHDKGSQPSHDPSSKDPSSNKNPHDPNGKRGLRKRLDSINIGSESRWIRILINARITGLNFRSSSVFMVQASSAP